MTLNKELADRIEKLQKALKNFSITVGEMIQQLIGMTYYMVVKKKLLSDKKAKFDIRLPKDCFMRVSRIIPIGYKNYELANGYTKLIKKIPVDFSNETLLILEFEYKNIDRI